MKNNDVLHIINNLKSNYDLASIQLVLNCYKNASYLCIKVKGWNPSRKLQKIKQEGFTWYLHKLPEKDLLSVYIINDTIIKKTDQLFFKILKEKYKINSKLNPGDVFETIIKKFIKNLKNNKQVSLNQKITQNLMCGLYYDYPIDEVYSFIQENYIDQKINKGRKALFFYTPHDQIGYITYHNNKSFLADLKRSYIQICQENDHKPKISKNYKIYKTYQITLNK